MLKIANLPKCPVCNGRLCHVPEEGDGFGVEVACELCGWEGEDIDDYRQDILASVCQTPEGKLH